jgi:5'-nucleotidase
MVAGPNEGSNVGPFLYTLSGTIGSTYAAVERGIPGIAFSAVNSTHRSYTTVPSNSTTDVATLNAKVAVKVVNQLATAVTSGRLLPLGYGVNVNIPLLNSTCSNPNYVQSRLTGGAIVDKAVFNSTSGIFTFGNDVNAGVNACINGDCSLPGETNVILGCSVAVSVFTTDYDAPSCGGAVNVRGSFQPLVQFQNATGSATSASNATTSTGSTPAQVTKNAAGKASLGSWAAFVGAMAAIMIIV